MFQDKEDYSSLTPSHLHLLNWEVNAEIIAFQDRYFITETSCTSSSEMYMYPSSCINTSIIINLTLDCNNVANSEIMHCHDFSMTNREIEMQFCSSFSSSCCIRGGRKSGIQGMNGMFSRKLTLHSVCVTGMMNESKVR